MDKRLEDLELVQKVFDKFGVKLVLVYGAVLGWYRDKAFLPGDEDIDLAVFEDVPYKTRKDIGWKLYELGFNPQPITFNVFGRQELIENGYNGTEKSGIIVCERGIKFTIFFFGAPEECKLHGLEHICVPKMGAVKLIATPAKFYKKLDTLKVGSKKYLVPSPVEEYLDYTYFNNWKDKTDRRHGNVYNEDHPDSPLFIEDINKKTDATSWK